MSDASSLPQPSGRRLSLFGRSVLLVVLEIVANALAWAIALAVFLRPSSTGESVLPLCLLAWTLGLRHGLDADHIAAIDSVIRRLIALGQRPVTVGLYFSLGHSTIVIALTIAIVISTSVIDHLDDLSNVGGVVGGYISASFLLLLAIGNGVILARVLRARKRQPTDEIPASELEKGDAHSEAHANVKPTEPQSLGVLTRIVRPLLRVIDRPWKMLIVGLCFGLGFDTASSVALLGVTALARGRTDLSAASLLVLPTLFTSGMTFVDSMDTIGMLWAYAADDLERGPRRWGLFEPKATAASTLPAKTRQRTPALSTLSGILLTMSILVAAAISLIEFMGLAADQCASCAGAAEDDPGLKGRWWRFWIAANDNSGYVGAGIVASFLLVVVAWYGLRWLHRRRAMGANANV